MTIKAVSILAFCYASFLFYPLAYASGETSAQATQHTNCAEMENEFKKVGVDIKAGNLESAVVLVSKLHGERIDSKTLTAALNKSVADAWDRYLTHASCSNLRLKIVRLLNEAGTARDLTTLKRKQLQATVLAAVTQPEAPTLIISMVNLVALKESLNSGLFPNNDDMKDELSDLAKTSSKSVNETSTKFKNLFSGTSLDEAPSDDFTKLLRDPKNSGLEANLKSYLLDEFQMADEIQKKVDGFAARLTIKD